MVRHRAMHEQHRLTRAPLEVSEPGAVDRGVAGLGIYDGIPSLNVSFCGLTPRFSRGLAEGETVGWNRLLGARRYFFLGSSAGFT